MAENIGAKQYNCKHNVITIRGTDGRIILERCRKCEAQWPIPSKPAIVTLGESLANYKIEGSCYNCERWRPLSIEFLGTPSNGFELRCIECEFNNVIVTVRPATISTVVSTGT